MSRSTPTTAAEAHGPRGAADKDDPACTCTGARRAAPVARDPGGSDAPPVPASRACSSDATLLLLSLIRRETQEALGCTEPGMVALAAARARRLVGGRPTAITVWASAPVLKNAQGVGLPGTQAKGVAVAAALGALAGDPDRGLMVLETVTAADATEAEGLARSGAVTVRLEPGRPGLYVRVEVRTEGRTGTRRAEVTIAGSHTDVVRETLDGEPVGLPGAPEARPGGPAAAPCAVERAGSPAAIGKTAPPLEALCALGFDDILQAALAVAPTEVAYLVAGAQRNLELGERTLAGGGRQAAPELVAALRNLAGPAARPDEVPDLAARARLLTAAAVSARMGGTAWPVLTSGGSGNQGILVSVPVLLASRSLGRDQTCLARALTLAHAVNLYLKAFAGEVSALCGSLTAGAGVAAAVAWLESLGSGREAESVRRAVQMVAGALFGAVCDGAKGSCALKIGESAATAVVAGRIAARGGGLPCAEGLVGRTVEETAHTVGRLTREILSLADAVLLERFSSS